jgi:hypothetical protein
MAPFSFMFMALGFTSVEEVNAVLESLKLVRIDRTEVTEGPKSGMAKFFVHYEDMVNAKLRADLEEFERRKSEGEVDVRPKRIVYGMTKDGREQYWQVFKCKTPAEREKQGKSEFAPRVE